MADINTERRKLVKGETLVFRGRDAQDGDMVPGVWISATVEGEVAGPVNAPSIDQLENAQEMLAVQFIDKPQPPIGNFPKLLDRWDGDKYYAEFQIVGPLLQEWKSVEEFDAAVRDAAAFQMFVAGYEWEAEGNIGSGIGRLRDEDGNEIASEVTYDPGPEIDDSIVGLVVGASGDIVDEFTEGLGNVTEAIAEAGATAVAGTVSGTAKGFLSNPMFIVVAVIIVVVLIGLIILLVKLGALEQIIDGTVPG